MDNLALAIIRKILSSGIGAPIAVIMMLMMIVLPLPPFVLDIMFTFNIAFAMLVLLAGVYTRKTLDFASFPTVLLVATLLRLALNIASTRVVLLYGHTGTDAAGHVVQSFGEFVVGGNYAVGLVVFSILVIINFVVVTKGAGRVSEVSARFTLDAMPGKQMAIDADLNAGLITQEEAKQRREEVSSESDFYGAMDGASKFVRGDAIAGILILLINIIGGLAIGVAQHDMTFGQAMQNYVLLTIGDGLVAQVPALLLSTAAAIMVTRVTSEAEVGEQIVSQVFNHPKSLLITSGVIGSLGLIPNMPHIPFLLLASILAISAYLLIQKQQTERITQMIKEQEEIEASTAATPQQGQERKELSWDDVNPVDTVGLEIGYRLIPLVDDAQGGELMARIKGVRKKLSQELGFLVPTVHIRDNLDLSPNKYSITLMGVTVGEAEVHLDKDLAINAGQVFGKLKGIETKDPAFNLDAVWIEAAQKEQAKSMGFTVVDVSTVIATHLSQILQDNAADLLGYDEVQMMLDRLAESMPKLVESLVPDTVPLSTVVKVMQALLGEQIPVRDIRTIAEVLADKGTKTQDPNILLGAVRAALGRLIVQNINGMEMELPVITLAPELEQILLQSSQVAGQEGGGLEPGLAQKLQQSLAEAAERQEALGQPIVLLVASPIRPVLSKFARHVVAGMHVLSFVEIPDTKQIKVVGTVGA